MTNLLDNFITPADAAIRLGVSRQRINQRLRADSLTAAAFGQGRRKEYAIHVLSMGPYQDNKDLHDEIYDEIKGDCLHLRTDYMSLYETAQQLGLKVQQTEHLLDKLGITIEQVGTVALQLVSREKVTAIPSSAVASIKNNTQRRKGRDLAIPIDAEITAEAVALQGQLAVQHHIQRQDVVRAGLSWLDCERPADPWPEYKTWLVFLDETIPAWRDSYHISRKSGRNGCTVVLTPCEGCALERIQDAYSLTTPQALDLAIVAASQSGVIEWWSSQLLTDSDTCGKLETSNKE